MLSYEDFWTVMRKWQVNLTKAFIVTLESKRHNTVRNSILALKEMRKSFPVILQYGRRIMNKFYEVAAGRTSGQGSTNNPNSDKNLKVLAASYSAFLGPGQTAAKECGKDQGPAGLARATKQWLLWQRQPRLLLVHQGLYPEDLA
ncbi:hypothetical protein EV180_006651, partial [Coemansia sp. RSA 518]